VDVSRAWSGEWRCWWGATSASPQDAGTPPLRAGCVCTTQRVNARPQAHQTHLNLCHPHPNALCTRQVKRAQIAEERRMANKGRKSLVASRIKKVLKMSEALIKTPDATQVPALEALVSEAYKSIDTAVSKGVIHANTAARRKARVAHWKRQVRFDDGAAAAVVTGLFALCASLEGAGEPLQSSSSISTRHLTRRSTSTHPPTHLCRQPPAQPRAGADQRGALPARPREARLPLLPAHPGQGRRHRRCRCRCRQLKQQQ